MSFDSLLRVMIQAKAEVEITSDGRLLVKHLPLEYHATVLEYQDRLITHFREDEKQFRYTIKNIPTMYKDVQFRSRLEARYAAFFDLVGFNWEYEPIDLNGWIPDFRIKIPCGHSDCPKYHELLVEVKPYNLAKQFNGHILQKYEIPYEQNAIGLGINPSVCTEWEMCHGDGGGFEEITNWTGEDWLTNWSKAGNIVQWKKNEKTNH